MRENRERAKQLYDRKASTKAIFFRRAEVLLLQLPTTNTFSEKVVRVEILDSLSPETVKARLASGRLDIVNKSRLSRYAAGRASGSVGEVKDVFCFADVGPSASAAPAEDDEEARSSRSEEGAECQGVLHVDNGLRSARWPLHFSFAHSLRCSKSSALVPLFFLLPLWAQALDVHLCTL